MTKWTNEKIYKLTNIQMNKWQWTKEEIKKWRNEQINKCANVQMNKWTKVQMKKRNEEIKKLINAYYPFIDIFFKVHQNQMRNIWANINILLYNDLYALKFGEFMDFYITSIIEILKTSPWIYGQKMSNFWVASIHI